MPVCPDSVAKNAAKALEWRVQYKRGMTFVGVRRAVQLRGKHEVSYATLVRMVRYFQRHAVDKKAASWKNGHKDGGPSNGKIAWYGWGGDEGYRWALKELKAKP